MTVTDTRPEWGQHPPAWMPPPPPAYVPPPRPRRTGLVLFWPTLALIAIALGTLGIFDVNGSVQPSAYVALAVAVIAVMLLVGAFVGRPGGLIALGIIASLGLASPVPSRPPPTGRPAARRSTEPRQCHRSAGHLHGPERPDRRST